MIFKSVLVGPTYIKSTTLVDINCNLIVHAEEFIVSSKAKVIVFIERGIW